MSSTSATRASLLSRARNRDSQAWEELLQLYSPLVAHWCHRSGMTAEGAADCIQEVFHAVSRKLEEFRPTHASGSFRAWLWTITRHKILDQFRKNAAQPKIVGGSTGMRMIEDAAAPALDSDNDPTELDAAQALMRRALLQIQAEFEPRTWKAFWRCVVDGLSTDQVGRELELAPAAVRQYRSRILRRLRQQLGDFEATG